MAEVKLTPAQRAVVEDRGGALLVSAAAGSGKTKVLVDRLLRQICDPACPRNIDEFLVITYTKAAAAELRMKIAQALSEKLSENPEDRHLQRQLHRIYLAEISTVHAFCSGILRTYAHVLDLPADFRVAEEVESKALQSKVLTELLEQSYGGIAQDPDFRAMVDTFGYGRDDRRLPEAVLMAHKQMRCRANMDRWVETNLQALELTDCDDISQTPWGQYLLQEHKTFLAQQEVKLSAALEEMGRYPNIEKGLGKVFAQNLQDLRHLRTLQTWDEFYNNPITDFGRAGAVKAPEDADVKERLAVVRDLYKEQLKKRQSLFCGTSAAMLEDLRHTTRGTQALLRFAQRFDQAYSKEKRQQKLMDFSDLEHAAIRLLTDRYTGKPTACAVEISKRYAEIMVDEYQDSNEIQDTIFEAVSRGGRNRFMVGDVKQSIYRFRLAEPEIFLGKYNTYPAHTEAQEGQPRKILLSENFRSRPEILSACNDVFRLVMRKSVGDLDYGDDEALRAGRPHPPLEGTPVELHCLTSSDGGDKADLEPDYVARQIRDMLDQGMPVSDGDGTRPVRPGDIVILMRGLSATAGPYRAALSRYGIPSVSDRGGDLLETSEIQILLSLLQIIDNPHQDVPLVAVMASPVFGFAPDELAVLRTAHRKGDLYDALVETAQTDGRFGAFLETLEALRNDQTWMNLHELVDSIFRRTAMTAVFAAMEDGRARARNLTAFRSFVVSFEAGGSKALPQLLDYVDQLRQSGAHLPLPKTSAENAVTIMTVHSSKGLEFPVVFLCDLSRRFNLSDMQDAILVDNELAVGCNRIDQARYVRYPTVAKQAIVRRKTEQAVSEELRILYVAMTRPKDRLIMTYYSKTLVTELKKITGQLTMPLSDDLVASAGNPGKWILMAALCRTEAGELFAQAGPNPVSQVSAVPWKILFRDLSGEVSAAEPLSVPKDRPAKTVELADYVQLDYRYKDACHVPAKLTATQLKGRTEDREAAEGAGEAIRPAPAVFRTPTFRAGGMTAAEKGTATHLFLQFADYAHCAEVDGVEAELQRLVREEFLTTEQADAVERQQVLTFFRSELGRWLLEQKEVHREFKFSLLVDAEKWYPQAAGEQIMLQGVVDCFVVQPDGITVLDFKTDRIADPQKYAGQLNAYGEALTRIYGLPVREKVLYFFACGEAFSVQ